jgi:hypothetical protein
LGRLAFGVASYDSSELELSSLFEDAVSERDRECFFDGALSVMPGIPFIRPLLCSFSGELERDDDDVARELLLPLKADLPSPGIKPVCWGGG